MRELVLMFWAFITGMGFDYFINCIAFEPQTGGIGALVILFTGISLIFMCIFVFVSIVEHWES